MKFDVILDKGRSMTIDLDVELKVDLRDINGELMRQPSKFANMSTLCALAKNKVDRLEAQLDKLEAQIDYKLRNRWPYKNIKPTEPAIKKAVLRSKRYCELQEEVFKAKKQLGLLYAARYSLSQRQESLIQLSANQRAEYQSQ